MNPELEALGDHIAASLGEAISDKAVAFGELTLVARGEDIVRVVAFLRDDPQCRFVCFVSICGADYPGRERRFDVVYHFLAPHLNRRVRVKVEADDMTPVPSIIDLFPAANWYERETYDLYGVLFSGHPDLRRLLTDYGFEGIPSARTSRSRASSRSATTTPRARVVYEPVKLPQEFRNFDFLSPWEGTDYVLPGDEKAKA